MDIEAQRQLQLLEAVERDSRVTQRGLAAKVGIALGLTNIYLKRLVRKGYIKCVNVQSNRLTYLITPRGIAEKARLTYEFLEYSLQLYSEVRQHLREVLHECAATGRRVAIFDEPSGRDFLGMPVRPIGQHTEVLYDLIVVATLDSPGPQIAGLIRDGVPPEKLFSLRRAPEATRRAAVPQGRVGSGAR
jgi:DNA-binding MarR family transcriptional regulator